MKNIFVLLFSLLLFSCQEKEKTYEELEAEILCDVFPEIAKYELEENLERHKILPLIPPPDLDSLKYSKRELDSIERNYEELKNIYFVQLEKNTDSLIKVLNQLKKYQLIVIDTLRDVKKLKIYNNQYLFDSLDYRGLQHQEFSKCNLEITLVPYTQTFEGGDRKTGNAVLFPTRVLIDKTKKKAYFSNFRIYESYHIFCEFSEKDERWKVKEIIKI